MFRLPFLFIILEVLQYLKRTLNDSLDSSILVDLLCKILIINIFYPCLLELLFRSVHLLLVGLCDLFIILGGDDDFVLVERLLTV